MKILFDEPVPRDLVKYFPDTYQVITAQHMGWESRANGELLRLAHEEAFDALITMDKNMLYQQNPNTLPIPVVVLSAPQQEDRTYLGSLIKSKVIPLLQEGVENRFYTFGAEDAQWQDDRFPDNSIREPVAVGYVC